MNDAKTDEATLRSLTSRYDALQAAAVRSAESPAIAKAELDALEADGELSPAESIVFWTALAQQTQAPSYTESVKSVHLRLVGRVLAYFGVPLP